MSDDTNNNPAAGATCPTCSSTTGCGCPKADAPAAAPEGGETPAA